jgi:hypothetical protein
VKHKFFQTLLFIALINCAAVISAAQDNPARAMLDSPASNATPQRAPQDAATGDTQTRSSASETFELNITERRITKLNFAASTAVEAGEESARGLRLRIGVGVGAEQIDVLLRNVHGLVRFRGTLDRVLELINSRRAPETGP